MSILLSSKTLFHSLQKTSTAVPSNMSALYFELNEDRIQKCDPLQSLPKSESIAKTHSTAKNLKQLLRRKSWTVSFRGFLQKEYSEENLDFWVDVEAYKKSSPKKQVKAAQTIYEKYLASSSPNEVNIDATTRKLTRENLHNPDPSTFDVAQDRVLTLMEKDSFRRFQCQYKNEQEKRKNSSITQLKYISQKVSALYVSSTSKKVKKRNDSGTIDYLSPNDFSITNFSNSVNHRPRLFTM